MSVPVLLLCRVSQAGEKRAEIVERLGRPVRWMLLRHAHEGTHEGIV